MKFEDVIEELGSFGPFQRRVFILVNLFETPAAWAMFLPVFISQQPTFTCPTSSNTSMVYESTSSGQYENFSLDSVTGGFAEKITSFCNSDGTFCDGAIFHQSSTRITWNMCVDHKLSPLLTITTLISTLQMLGVLIGACVAGQLADSFGRRKIYYLVYFLLLLSGCLQCVTSTWKAYAACRVLVGFFFGGTMVIQFVIPMEFIGPKWRTFCGCIGFWAVGVMLLALLAYFIKDWKALTLTCFLVGVPLLFTYWLVPESPRWLLQKQRYEEAENILNRIATYNKKILPDISKLTHPSNSQNLSRHEGRYYSYWDLFRTPTLAKNTLIIMFSWFVCSSVYYGTSFQMGNLTGNLYINFFISGLVEIPALIIVVFINNIIGRKKTICIFLMTAGFSCLGIMALKFMLQRSLFTLSEHVSSYIVRCLAFLGKAGIAGGWAAAQVFSAEVFPTVVRNIGIGASSMSARVGGIVAPLLVALNDYSTALPFGIFGALALTSGLLTVFLPETLNAPLPDALPEFSTCHQWKQCCLGKKDDSIVQDGTCIHIKIVPENEMLRSTEKNSSAQDSMPLTGDESSIKNNHGEGDKLTAVL